MSIKVSGWTDAANGGTMVETEIVINDAGTGLNTTGPMASSEIKLIVDENTYTTLAANSTQTAGHKVIINMPSSYATAPTADQALAISGTPTTDGNGVTTINTHFVTVGGGGGGGGGTVTSVNVISSNNNIAVSGGPVTLNGDITLTPSPTPHYQSVGLTHGTGNALKTVTLKVNAGTDETLVLPDGGTATTGKFLKVLNVANGTVTTEWAAGGGGGGGVSSITAGAGLTGGTITGSGTIALADDITVFNVSLTNVNDNDKSVKLESAGTLAHSVVLSISDEGIGTGKLLSAKTVSTSGGVTTIGTDWIAGDGAGTVTSVGVTGGNIVTDQANSGAITAAGTIALATDIKIKSVELEGSSSTEFTKFQNGITGKEITIKTPNNVPTDGQVLGVASHTTVGNAITINTHWQASGGGGGGSGTVTSVAAGANLVTDSGDPITVTGSISLADDISVKSLFLPDSTGTAGQGVKIKAGVTSEGVESDTWIFPSDPAYGASSKQPMGLAVIDRDFSTKTCTFGFHDLNYIETILKIETPQGAVNGVETYSYTEFVNLATILGTGEAGIRLTFPATNDAKTAHTSALGNMALVSTNGVSHQNAVGANPAHYEANFDFKPVCIANSDIKVTSVGLSNSTHNLTLKTVDTADGSITLTTTGASAGKVLSVVSNTGGAVVTDWVTAGGGGGSGTVTSISVAKGLMTNQANSGAITSSGIIGLINTVPIGISQQTGDEAGHIWKNFDLNTDQELIIKPGSTLGALTNTISPATVSSGLVNMTTNGSTVSAAIRSIVAGSGNSNITVTHGDGQSGNPTISVVTHPIFNSTTFLSDAGSAKIKFLIDDTIAGEKDIHLPTVPLGRPKKSVPMVAQEVATDSSNIRWSYTLAPDVTSINFIDSGSDDYSIQLVGYQGALDNQSYITSIRLPGVNRNALPAINSPLVVSSATGGGAVSTPSVVDLKFGAPALVASGDQLGNGIALGSGTDNEVVFSEVVINADKEISNLKSVGLVGGDASDKTMIIQHSATSNAANVVYVFPEGVPTVSDRLVVSAVNTVADITTITFGYETV